MLNREGEEDSYMGKKDSKKYFAVLIAIVLIGEIIAYLVPSNLYVFVTVLTLSFALFIIATNITNTKQARVGVGLLIAASFFDLMNIVSGNMYVSSQAIVGTPDVTRASSFLLIFIAIAILKAVGVVLLAALILQD